MRSDSRTLRIESACILIDHIISEPRPPDRQRHQIERIRLFADCRVLHGIGMNDHHHAVCAIIRLIIDHMVAGPCNAWREITSVTVACSGARPRTTTGISLNSCPIQGERIVIGAEIGLCWDDGGDAYISDPCVGTAVYGISECVVHTIRNAGWII